MLKDIANTLKNLFTKQPRKKQPTEIGKIVVTFNTEEGSEVISFTKTFVGQAHYSDYFDYVFITSAEDKLSQYLKAAQKKGFHCVSETISIPTHRIKVMIADRQSLILEV